MWKKSIEIKETYIEKIRKYGIINYIKRKNRCGIVGRVLIAISLTLWVM